MLVRKIISLSAAASVALCAVPAARAADYTAAVRSASVGYELLNRVNENSYEGWQGFNTDTIGVSGADGSSLSAEKEKASEFGVYTGIGDELFKTASAGAMYWDFEDEAEFQRDEWSFPYIDLNNNNLGNYYDDIAYGEDVVKNGTDDNFALGKWTALSWTDFDRRIQPAYIPISNAIGYNQYYRYKYPTNGSANKTEVKAHSEGSTQCVVIRTGGLGNQAQRGQVMGMRVKLSRTEIQAGRTYDLSFWHMNNSTGSGNRVFAFFRRFNGNDDDLIYTALNDTKTNGLPWLDRSAGNEAGASTRYWQQFNTQLTPAEEDFDEDGYTTLWILMSAAADYSTPKFNRVLEGGYAYFDDVKLIPEQEARQSDYEFSCRVKGTPQTEVKVYADISGRKLFETDAVISDGWTAVNADFSMSSDDEFILGASHGTQKKWDSDKVKLYIVSSGGEELYAEDISLKKRPQSSVAEFAGSTVGLSAEVYFSSAGSEEAALVCNAADENGEYTVGRTDFVMEHGLNSVYLTGKLPNISNGGRLEYYFVNTRGERISERIYTDRFFANGVNLMSGESYDLSEVISIFGAGRYLIEFSVSGADGKAVTVSCGDVKESITAESDGIYCAEPMLTGAGILSIDSGGAVISDITVKKTSDI